jgi:hypothetical protein
MNRVVTWRLTSDSVFLVRPVFSGYLVNVLTDAILTLQRDVNARNCSGLRNTGPIEEAPPGAVAGAPCVIHETARGQFRRMFAAEDRADNVRRQNRETEEPCRIGRYDAFCFGNVLKG